MARVLLMDDDVDQSELLAALLMRKGHEVTLAPNASEATTLVSTRKFDVVITDIFVKEKDVYVADGGLRLIGHIRNGNREAPTATPSDVPIIAVSGVLGGPSDGHFLRLASEIGANIRLQKPLDAETLSDQIDRLVTEHEDR